MSLKKLSLAAALSIGILTVNGIANAACPVCPQQEMIPQESACPVQTTLCPTCKQDPCTCKPACPAPCAPCVSSPISATVPNCNANAKVIQRQAFAYPTIGHSSVVMPRGKTLTQIGGDQESIAASQCGSGLTAAPESCWPLTLYPKHMTGAACGIVPVCPNQVTQGTDILRCNMPNSTGIFQSTGGAAPFASPCSAPCPTSSCDPCQSNIQCSPCQTGAAAQLQGCPIPIQTSSGLEIQKTIMVPGAAAPCPAPTGCACPVGNQYPDVSNNMYAGCDINTLTSHGVLAGYPDRMYKPNLPILRSEFASAMVAGLELQNVPDFGQKMVFKDVPNSFWAKSNIDKAYNRGIMTGYPNDSFKPKNPVSRAEALSTMAKVLPGTMTACDAQGILKAYPDANELPSWATIPVAEALNAGLNKNLPDSTHIRPNDTATRAEIASMLKELRVKLCLEPVAQTTVGAAAPCPPPMEQKMITQTIPTLKVQMRDIVTARTSLIGDRFVANTVEPVTIGGQYFPSGSEVRGRVVEVIRPTMGDNGGIRLAFDKIQNQSCKADLPKDILSATVVKEKDPNIIGRALAFPFTLPGKVIGIAGRTVGGGVTIVGNASEGILNNFGNGTNELFNAEFRAAGRSYISSGRELFVGAADLVRDGVSGVAGILKEGADEVAYVVSPDGSRIAQINPKEKLSIAFGCK